MKRRYIETLLGFLLLCLLSALPAVGQATGTVKGVCKDQQGNPIVDGVVRYMSVDTGRKYELKTNKKGEFFSLGIVPGKYNVSLSKDGKELFHFNGVPVNLDENVLDFDLKKELAGAAQEQGISQEQLKQMQEQQNKQQKENNIVKTLNEKLAAANDASAAGNYDSAIATLTEATQLDPSRDLVWFKLGDAYRSSAPKQTDSAEKTKRYESAIDAYNKAIQLKQGDASGAKPDPDAGKKMAAYYNNLGEAYARSGKADDAMKAYGQAAQLDPAGAGQYYYNLGAVLTNANKADDAIAAFDKAIAADPNRADAYYWKGVNLIAKAKTDSNGKVVPAPGTEEALNKYLELQPTGQYADGAKGMLQYIGSTVETSFGKKKQPPKK
jgi:tetratricopeptide (TPR) repeat protein